MPDMNPDGTKQVTPPTRSAFDPPSAPVKAGAVQKDTGDKEKTAAEHLSDIGEGIKGLVRQHYKSTINENEAADAEMDPAVKAVSQGVASAPGNTADH